MDKQAIGYLLNGLEYDWATFTLPDLITAIQSKRNRPLRVVSMPDLVVPLCLNTGKIDFIFFSDAQTKTKQVHDILHELAHIFLGHIDNQNISDVQEIILHLDLRFRTFGQEISVHAENEEIEAEYLAYLIQARISQHNRLVAMLQFDYTDDSQTPPFTSVYLK